MDAVDGQFLCRGDILADRGRGVRFRLRLGDRIVPAFAIRFHGRVYAYLNQCAHQEVELDWQPGHFFDSDRDHLICATHGALYDPATGACASGRCSGRALTALAVEEREGRVYLVDSADGVQLKGVEKPDG